MVKSLLFFFIFLTSSAAQAHPLDLGYIEITKQGDSVFKVAFELNPQAAEHFTRLAGGFSGPEPTSRNSRALFLATLGSTKLLSDGQPCSWIRPETRYAGTQQVRLTVEATCPRKPSGLVQLDLDFLKNASRTYQVLGKAVLEGRENTFLAEPGNREIKLTFTQSPSIRFSDFVGMGVRHIGAAPSEWHDQGGYHLPDGIDHILFLLALILGGGALFWRTLKTATGFTLGHSITLSLASFNVIHLPGRVVESAIALSIVFVAVEALLKKDDRSRWRVAALFGLVHGFGFATALQELHLDRSRMLPALLGFNLGVETGQALIIAAVLPLFYLARQRPVLYRYAVQGGASAIGIAGSYWFVHRAFG